MLNLLLSLVRRHRTASVIAFVLGTAGFLFFVNIIEDVLTGDSGPVDKLLLRRAHALANSSDGDWLTPLAHGLSLLGNWQAVVPLGLLLLVLAWRGRLAWRAFLFYFVACGGSGALAIGFKYLINRPRPQIVPALEKAPLLSFPSGHSLYALVAWGFVAYLIARRPHTPPWLRVVLVLAALAIAGLVGASRVYLAAHYPSDVSGGWLIGVPWLLFVLWAFEGRSGAQGRVMAAVKR